MEEIIANIIQILLNNVGSYLIIGVMTSIFVELIHSLLISRAKLLYVMLSSMLDGLDQERTKLFFTHPFVSPLGLKAYHSGKYTIYGFRSAYIPPALFAKAVGDVVLDQDGTLRLHDFEEGRLKRMFVDIRARTNGDNQAFYSELRSWFQNAMSQGTAIYKRQSQMMSFVIGLVLAITFNISTNNLSFTSLERSPSATSASESATKEHKAQNTWAPLGWWTSGLTINELLTLYTGWIIAATSCYLLSPLWFDIMNRFANLRSDGIRPDDETAIPTSTT